MPKISSVVALVSGGASGLGEAVARRLVAGQARVVIAEHYPQDDLDEFTNAWADPKTRAALV